MAKLPEGFKIDDMFPGLVLHPNLREGTEEHESDVQCTVDEIHEFCTNIEGLPLFNAKDLKYLEPASKAVTDVKKKMEAKRKVDHPCKNKFMNILIDSFDSIFSSILVNGQLEKLFKSLTIEETYSHPMLTKLMHRKSNHDREAMNLGESLIPFNAVKLVIGNYFLRYVDKIIHVEESLNDEGVKDSRTIGLTMKNTLGAFFKEIFGFDLPIDARRKFSEIIDDEYDSTPASIDRKKEFYKGVTRANVDETWSLRDPDTWWELYRHSAFFLIQSIRRGTPGLVRSDADTKEALNYITTKLFRGVDFLFPDEDDVESLHRSYNDLLRDAAFNKREIKKLFVDKVSIGQQLLNIMQETVVRDKRTWAIRTVCEDLIDLMEGRTSIESNLGEDTQKEMAAVREVVIDNFKAKGAEHVGVVKGCVDQFKIVIIDKRGKKIPLMIEVAPNKNAISAWRKAIAKGASYPTMLDLVRMRVWLVGGKRSTQNEVDHCLKYGYAYVLEAMGSTIPKELFDNMKYHFDQFDSTGATGGTNAFSEGQNVFKGFVKVVRPGESKLMSNKPAEVQIGTDFPDHNHDDYENKQFVQCKEYLGATSYRQHVFDMIDYCISDAPENLREFRGLTEYSTDPNGPAYIQMFMELLRMLLNPEFSNFEMICATRFMTQYLGEYETNEKLRMIVGIINRYYIVFHEYFNVGKVTTALLEYRALMKERYELKIKKDKAEATYKDFERKYQILDLDITREDKVEKLRNLGLSDQGIEAVMSTNADMRSKYLDLLEDKLSEANSEFSANWNALKKLRATYEGLVPDPK